MGPSDENGDALPSSHPTTPQNCGCWRFPRPRRAPSLRREPPWERRRPAGSCILMHPDVQPSEPRPLQDIQLLQAGRFCRCLCASGSYSTSHTHTHIEHHMTTCTKGCSSLRALADPITSSSFAPHLRIVLASQRLKLRPPPEVSVSCAPGKQSFSAKAFSTGGRSHSAACCYTSAEDHACRKLSYRHPKAR